MPYIETGDIEKFLNITLTADGIALVTDLIVSIDAFVDDYCNRTWSKTSSDEIAEIFDGGTDLFFINYPPIVSVTSVKTDIRADYAGDLLEESEDEFYVYDTYVKLASPASDIPRSVEIKYKTSATTVPEDLKHAIVRWVSEIFKSQDSAGKAVSRVSIGPMSIDYLTKDGIPLYVEKVLNRYRLINV